jgi:cytochrome c-type biogenesis protein CcmH
MAALAAGCSRGDDIPELERRAQAINRDVMCPVCPGESIDQSQNPMAVQMRGIVMDRLEQGWTAAQIKAYFVDRYEPRVLMEPPRSGFNLVAWLVPPVAVGGAIAALVLVLRFMRGRGEPEPDDVLELSPSERADYFARIEAIADGGTETAAAAAPTEAERAP